ncbi:hypothetical protein [Prescottella agglutinans]|jgi:hypothetical protein|uniref:Uncharacterized protein n=1 Tax=Prescottella agglutinans TaxID=1644129 RepID=A0ABT6ML85_9NOCA|nr:hypothetical protein [Prescottella agglutinans]MDH6285075.1 hypothetical protein [Prescottella agglutinans]
MTAPGLDGWTESFPESPVLRRLPVPTDVVVDISGVFPAGPGFTRADQLPLRIRTCAVQLESRMFATLHSWLRVANGKWIAQVCIPATAPNERSSVDLWRWVDGASVQPR